MLQTIIMFRFPICMDNLCVSAFKAAFPRLEQSVKNCTVCESLTKAHYMQQKQNSLHNKEIYWHKNGRFFVPPNQSVFHSSSQLLSKNSTCCYDIHGDKKLFDISEQINNQFHICMFSPSCLHFLQCFFACLCTLLNMHSDSILVLCYLQNWRWPLFLSSHMNLCK